MDWQVGAEAISDSDFDEDTEQLDIHGMLDGGAEDGRQGEKQVHARIRAVYNDVGRSSISMKHVTSNATSALNSKVKGFQGAEIHDEYFRLLDAETELKAACLQEQQKRVKTVAHVRRLEEIITMKDKKIESLLHAKAVGADRSMSTSKSVVQRDMAERDRQYHALTQKLRQKIAQQSQLLSSYEEAMQSLRSGIKSTNLAELEEERSQLYEELHHHQEILGRQRLEWEAHQQKLVAFAEAEASNKLQIAKLQQENKVIAHEKRKLEQEVGALKSRVELLQSNLALEQRKRTYDRDFSESVGKHAPSTPTQKEMLAQALDEMKKLMRKETLASIRREKLKSPKTGTITDKPASVVATTSSPSVSLTPKTPNRSTSMSPRKYRSSSAALIRYNGTALQQANQTKQLSLGKRSHRSTIDGVSVDAFSTPVAPVLQTSSLQNQSTVEQVDQTQRELVHAVQPEAQIALSQGSHESQHDTITQRDDNVARECSNTLSTLSCKDEQQNALESLTQSCQSSNLKVYPVSCQRSDISVVEVDQNTDKELSEMQQKQIASSERLLLLDDNDPESELSAELLDDAEHPKLRSDAEIEAPSPDDAINAPLIEFNTKPSTNEVSSPDNRGQPSQDFDYPSDFYDADARTSTEGDNEGSSEDGEGNASESSEYSRGSQDSEDSKETTEDT
ncbi:unnamed protein product [Phytophthora lilii]|uniref:Unnamed protein product n=1 Tax=Phytophthora lilii TaxID=2077276 RepID=A0A9W6XC06_9STRA|nr:unnamed protein product [Phytophthora lilii]